MKSGGQPNARLLSPADVLAACDAAGWKFRRPPTNVGTSTWVSHHTYVTNVAGVDDGVLQSAASACGPLLRVTRLVPPTAAGTASGGATPVFEAAVLTYATVDDAQAAQAALDGAPPLPGAASTRPLVARLSELELSPVRSCHGARVKAALGLRTRHLAHRTRPLPARRPPPGRRRTRMPCLWASPA